MKSIAKFLFAIMAISLLPSVALASDEPKADDRAYTATYPYGVEWGWSL